MFKDRGTTGVLIMAAGLFFALGYLAAIGPSLPELARNNSIALDAAGWIFTSLFLGALPAEIFTDWLMDKFGARYLLLAGMLVMAAGLFSATLSRSLPLTLACMIFAGLGDGVLIVGVNVVVAQSFTRRRASALNLLNVFFGLGAISGPAIVGASIAFWGTPLPAIWGMAILLVALTPTVVRLRAGGRVTREERAAALKGESVFRSPILWLFSILLLLYVGVEVGTGGWIATYMQITAQFIPQTAALVASGYYLGITVGRIAAAGLGTRLSAERLLLVSLVGAVLGGLVMLFSVGNGAVTIAGTLLLGASFGPIFPTIIAILTAHFTVGAGKAASMAIASGSAGGTLIPLLQGWLLGSVGAQALAQFLVAITGAMLAVLGFFTIGDWRKGTAIVAQSTSELPVVE